MQYNRRSPVAVLLLSVVTCGIYGYVVFYQISKEVREFTNDQSIDPAIELLLVIFTGGIYDFFWFYKYSRKIYEMQIRTGVYQPADNTILTVLLSLVCSGAVSLAIEQMELNRVWDIIRQQPSNQ